MLQPGNHAVLCLFISLECLKVSVCIVADNSRDDEKQRILTYVSKSRSYNVSANGTFTGFHIFEEAASAGCDGAPSMPVADAMAVAAIVDPVYNKK